MPSPSPRTPRRRIRTGIGGWTFAPWWDTFYPADLPRAQALEYASRQFPAIEVNGTFYGAQKPSTFTDWHDRSPDDFVFALKAPRVATHRKRLAEARGSVDRFVEGGIDRLGDKLGPLVWQFPPTQAFVATEFDGFLSLLPATLGRHPLRHALDVRHPSFASKDFVALARRHRVAIVATDAPDVVQLSDVTADFTYARLRRAQSRLKSGYPRPELQRWAERAQAWRDGAGEVGLPLLARPAVHKRRDVFLFFINGAKERAPAAATAFLSQL